MDRLIKWFGGYVLVELSGYSPERLINLCGYNGIELWGMSSINGTHQFYVRRQDFKQLVGFVRKSKNRLIIRKKYGLPFCLRSKRRYRWFASGILLCLLILYILSLHIWQITFDGNSYFTDELLAKALSTKGYDAGMRKEQIRCDDLEMMLRESYPEITWVSAQIKGTELYIQIRENTGILTVNESETQPCDLVASRDGIITHIITRTGTPLVKQGDIVTAGQTLVKGTVELFNDSKEKTGEHLVTAEADIYAQTEILYEDHFEIIHPQKWYTGENRYCLILEVMGHCITIDLSGIPKNNGNTKKQAETDFYTKLLTKLPLLKKIPCIYIPCKYDTVTSYGQIKIKSLELPIHWQLTTHREYEVNEAIYSKQQAYSKAEEKLVVFFEKLLEKGVQIIEKNVRIDTMGDECVAQGTITVIEPIGHAVPITQNAGDQEDAITR